MTPARWSTPKFLLAMVAWILGNIAAVGWLAYDSRTAIVAGVRK